jgi:hypothetical protein
LLYQWLRSYHPLYMSSDMLTSVKRNVNATGDD